MDKAREIAIKILNEVHEEGAYANVALAQALLLSSRKYQV